jgi:hypothetical protein
MPNAIKYNVSAETLALKKGNFWIGTGDVSKGPTSSTGYYNGITPPSGGYTIYLNKASGGPSIYSVTSDAQLITLTNQIAGTNYTTAVQCLTYYAGQTDKMIFNRDYESIITNGLVMNLDAGFTPSYPTTTTTWYDVSSGGNNGTLTNGPTFNSANGGSIVFDGVDDYIGVPNGYTSVMKGNDYWTVSLWFKANGFGCCGPVLISPGNGQLEYFDLFLQVSNGTVYFSAGGGAGSNYLSGNISMTTNVVYNVVFVKTGINTGKFYLNTSDISLSASGTGLGAMPNVNADFKIGAFKQSQWDLNGNIYNTLMYNRALSSTEVLQNYNAQKGRFGL